MNRNLIAGLLLPALALSACSSRPREFTPTLSTPAAKSAELDAAYSECRQLLVEGKLDSSGRLGSGAAGAAAGATTAAVGAAAASSAGLYGGMAVASATIILAPIALIGGAWGMSRIKRAKKEQAIKTAMAGCLQERGFVVGGWTKAGKKPKAISGQATAATEEPRKP
jgi:hypothetical protein